MGGQILYLDPWSGVSGDMLLAALLDADKASGRAEVVLRSAVDALGLEGTSVEITRGVERGLDCTRVTVDDGEAAPLRRLQEMEQVISGAALSWGVRQRSVAAVRRLAEVEASIHGCAVDEIHFHEIGAVDTLVDIVGAFALVEALGVDTVFVGTIPVGGGTVEIAHGVMGVPAPATLRLLEGYPVIGGPEDRELTTPTGALLVSELGSQAGGMPSMRPELVGYGAGSTSLARGANVLRAVLGSRLEASVDREFVVEVETDVDDVTPEVVGHVTQRLLALGALDSSTIPVSMKKGRPGVLIRALVRQEDEEAAVRCLFEETGSLGVRRRSVFRYVAERGIVRVMVDGHSVGVKWGRWKGRLISVAPEYDDCHAVASETGVPLKEVQRLAGEAGRQALSDEDHD